MRSNLRANTFPQAVPHLNHRRVAELRKSNSIFPVLHLEMASYSFLLRFIHSYGEQWSSGILFRERVRYPFDKSNKLFSGTDQDWFERTLGPFFPMPEHFPLRLSLCRLGQVVEGGGKQRIFAIGNYVNQRLWDPVFIDPFPFLQWAW